LGREAALVSAADFDRRRSGFHQGLVEKFRSEDSSFHLNTYPVAAVESEDSVHADDDLVPKYLNPGIVFVQRVHVRRERLHAFVEPSVWIRSVHLELKMTYDQDAELIEILGRQRRNI
jgi:hypothetical protein